MGDQNHMFSEHCVWNHKHGGPNLQSQIMGR